MSKDLVLNTVEVSAVPVQLSMQKLQVAIFAHTELLPSFACCMSKRKRVELFVTGKRTAEFSCCVASRMSVGDLPARFLTHEKQGESDGLARNIFLTQRREQLGFYDQQNSEWELRTLGSICSIAL